MTTTEPTGAELDAAIAEALGFSYEKPPYSHDPRWAVTLLAEMEQRGFGWYMSHGIEMPSYTAVFQKRDPAQAGRLLSWDYTANTLPLAIARAALAALRSETCSI